MHRRENRQRFKQLRDLFLRQHSRPRASSLGLTIEELNPLYEVKFIFRLPKKIQRVTLEPQGIEIPFTEKFGKVELTLDKLVCHQMIVLHY